MTYDMHDAASLKDFPHAILGIPDVSAYAESSYLVISEWRVKVYQLRNCYVAVNVRVEFLEGGGFRG